MDCPKCGGNARTMDTMYYNDREIYRRRKCLMCKYVFKSVEIIEDDIPTDKKDEFHRRYVEAVYNKSPLYKANFERRIKRNENH